MTSPAPRPLEGVVAHLDLHRAREAPLRPARRPEEQGEFVVERLEPAGQHAGRGEPGGEPEVADEHEGVPVADPPRREVGPRGYARHLEPHEVVADGEAPDLLTDALGRAAAEGLLAL